MSSCSTSFGAAEAWADVSAPTLPAEGEAGIGDFSLRWPCSDRQVERGRPTDPASLQDLLEAHARIVSVSPSVHFSKGDFVSDIIQVSDPGERARLFNQRLMALLGRADVVKALGQSADVWRAFLLHIAWHESNRLRTRIQAPRPPSTVPGPARSLFQTEAARTYDDWKNMSPTNLQLRKDLLAALAGTSVTKLEDAASKLKDVKQGDPYPNDNLFLALFEDANDDFDIVWCRVAFKRWQDQPTGDPKDDAKLWFKRWKVTDPKPDAVMAAFEAAAREVDALVAGHPQPADEPSSRRFEAPDEGAWAADLEVIEAVQAFCVPANANALSVRDACDRLYEANKTDCKDLVRAVVTKVSAGTIDLPGTNADDVVNGLAASNAWAVTYSVQDAIQLAIDGSLVVAGATSAELGPSAKHGHLAIVVGCPGESSDGVTVPVGCAGSIVEGARLQAGRLSGTFPKKLVQTQKIRYFSRTLS